jgi:hypothetical protein
MLKPPNPGTRLLDSEKKAMYRPSADIWGPPESRVPKAPAEETEISSVVAVAVAGFVPNTIVAMTSPTLNRRADRGRSPCAGIQPPYLMRSREV